MEDLARAVMFILVVLFGLGCVSSALGALATRTGKTTAVIGLLFAVCDLTLIYIGLHNTRLLAISIISTPAVVGLILNLRALRRVSRTLTATNTSE